MVPISTRSAQIQMTARIAGWRIASAIRSPFIPRVCPNDHERNYEIARGRGYLENSKSCIVKRSSSRVDEVNFKISLCRNIRVRRVVSEWVRDSRRGEAARRASGASRAQREHPVHRQAERLFDADPGTVRAYRALQK